MALQPVGTHFVRNAQIDIPAPIVKARDPDPTSQFACYNKVNGTLSICLIKWAEDDVALDEELCGGIS